MLVLPAQTWMTRRPDSGIWNLLQGISEAADPRTASRAFGRDWMLTISASLAQMQTAIEQQNQTVICNVRAREGPWKSGASLSQRLEAMRN